MKKIFDFFDKYLPKNIFIQFFLLFFLVTIINISTNYLLGLILDNSILEIKNKNKEQNKFVLFLGMVFFAPFFETLVFQWIPTYLFTYFNKSSKYDIVFVTITSIIFGFVHSSSLTYIISSFIIGFCYISISLYYAKKNKNFFLPIAVIHFLNNLIVFFYYLL